MNVCMYVYAVCIPDVCIGQKIVSHLLVRAIGGVTRAPNPSALPSASLLFWAKPLSSAIWCCVLHSSWLDLHEDSVSCAHCRECFIADFCGADTSQKVNPFQNRAYFCVLCAHIHTDKKSDVQCHPVGPWNHLCSLRKNWRANNILRIGDSGRPAHSRLQRRVCHSMVAGKAGLPCVQLASDCASPVRVFVFRSPLSFHWMAHIVAASVRPQEPSGKEQQTVFC